ncbi:MAG: pilus assembly protein [Acidobacteria bacterium]|nr:pilus assembly protein [Acidobacteriota bacterium]
MTHLDRALNELRPPCARRFARDERGTALLEAALTVPLVLLISIGIFEFGRAYQTWQVLTNAAREGARVSVLPNPASGAVEARVRAYLQSGQLPGYSSATVTVDRSATLQVGGATVTASQVTVDYPFTFIALLPVARLVDENATAGGAITIRASAVMRNEVQ